MRPSDGLRSAVVAGNQDKISPHMSTCQMRGVQSSASPRHSWLGRGMQRGRSNTPPAGGQVCRAGTRLSADARARCPRAEDTKTPRTEFDKSNFVSRVITVIGGKDECCTSTGSTTVTPLKDREGREQRKVTPQHVNKHLCSQ